MTQLFNLNIFFISIKFVGVYFQKWSEFVLDRKWKKKQNVDARWNVFIVTTRDSFLKWNVISETPGEMI